MTDARMERIINQLAELTEEEENILISKISEAREKRRREKFSQLYDTFFNTWTEIENLGYNIYWGDNLINCNDITFE